MKKLLLFVLLSFTVFSYTLSPMKISEEVNGLKVSVDERIELLNVIQYLAGCEEINKNSNEYSQSLEKYFKNYKNHKSVKYFMKLKEQGFGYDAPITLVLYLNENFEYRVNPTDYLIERMQLNDTPQNRKDIEENMEEFKNVMKEFAKDTDFNKFFLKNQKKYKEEIKHCVDLMEGQNFVKNVNNYYGKNIGSFEIVVGKLLRGGYGAKINTKNGAEIYAVIQPLIYGDDKQQIADIKYLIIHEFTHSFINPLEYSQENKLSGFRPLYEALDNVPKVYTMWSCMLREHLVRAATIRIGFKEQEELFIDFEEKQGFMYIKEFVELFKEYEDNRTKYKTIDEFFPRFVELIPVLQEKIKDPEYFLR